MNKVQEETDKPGNLDPMTAVLPDITLLINERNYLQEEVTSLRQNLDNEQVRYTKLKTLKCQQVCALTFKLAKAIRDKERALDEKDETITSLQDRIEELEVHNATLEEKVTLLERGDSNQPLPLTKMSCAVVASVLKNAYHNNTSKNMVDKPYDREPGQEYQTTDEHLVELTSLQSVNGDDQKEHIEEFAKIKQELSDVKKNMLVVQALNARLSNDLQALRDLKVESRAISGLSSTKKKKKNGRSSVLDCTDGCQEIKTFVFQKVSAEMAEVDESGNSSENSSSAPSPMQNNISESKSHVETNLSKYNIIINEHHDTIENGEDKLTNIEHSDTTIENSESKFKKQLEQAMKELQDMRADNHEIKQQMSKMIKCSVDHEDFLRKTTDFTGKMLKEMKEREEKQSQRTSADCYSSLKPLETRLDDIIKVVDYMTHEPVIRACETPVVLSPRPQSACLLPSKSAFTPVPQKAQTYTSSSSHQQLKNKIHRKLSDVALYERKGLTSGVSGLRNISMPLPKEWKSTESLNTRFTGSLGYRDYIHRHIVTSSSAIAKIRDLTPEELANQRQITY